jgi:hypothetical protein
MIGEVRPEPFERDYYSIAHPSQEEDMNQTPDPPSKGTGEAQPAKLGDRRLPADRRKTACMAISEGRWWPPALNASLDDRGYVAALLLGCGREAGHWVAVPSAG